MSDGSGASVDRAEGTRAGIGAGLANPVVWLTLVVVALAVYVYRPLFLPVDDYISLSAQSDEFFFEANRPGGWPVLILAAWLFFRRSHYADLLAGRSAPLPAGVALCAAIALFSWGVYTSSPDLRLLSALLVLIGGVLLCGGFAALRAFWVPIAFLVLSLPIPPVLLSATIFPVQLLTAKFAGFVLNAIGVQSVVQGDQILRHANTFIVIESCSGMKTIVVLTMLNVLLIDLFERRGKHAALLFATTPIVSFLTNGLRVVTLVLNPHSAIHSIHMLQGVAMQLVGVTGLYAIDAALERLLGTRDPSAEQGDYGFANTERATRTQSSKRLALVAGVLIALIAADRSLPRWTHARDLAELPDALLARVFGEQSSAKVTPDYQFTGSVRYLAHARRRVAIEGDVVDVHLGVGDEQERRFTLLSPRLAWPDSGYATLESSEVVLEPGGRTARRMLLRRGAQRVLAYSWFERRGSFWYEWWRQAAALDRSPFVRPEHILAVRLATPVDDRAGGLRAAEARVHEAWERLAPELDGYAPTASGPAGAPSAQR